MVETIVKKLTEMHIEESKSLEEILYEGVYNDYDERNKSFEVGDVVLTKYYSTRSRQMVSAHRIMIITSIKQDGGVTQYEGYPLKTDRGKSNKYPGGYPNSLSINNYKTILVPGENVPYPEREAFIDVRDFARFRSYDISPQASSYAGHVTDEFYEFVMKGRNNYKSGRDNSNLHWEK